MSNAVPSMAVFGDWMCSGKIDRHVISYAAGFLVASSLRLSQRNISRASFCRKNRSHMINGYSVGIWSAAFLQAHDIGHLDRILFRRLEWTACGHVDDVHIFCLYKGLHPSDSLMEHDLWEFYIIAHRKLGGRISDLTVVPLQTLFEVGPAKTGYGKLRESGLMMISA